jgi:hypothetical protein
VTAHNATVLVKRFGTSPTAAKRAVRPAPISQRRLRAIPRYELSPAAPSVEARGARTSATQRYPPLLWRLIGRDLYQPRPNPRTLSGRASRSPIGRRLVADLTGSALHNPRVGIERDDAAVRSKQP